MATIKVIIISIIVLFVIGCSNTNKICERWEVKNTAYNIIVFNTEFQEDAQRFINSYEGWNDGNKVNRFKLICTETRVATEYDKNPELFVCLNNITKRMGIQYPNGTKGTLYERYICTSWTKITK